MAIRHPHNVKDITTRTVNGCKVERATIVEDNGYFSAIVTDWNGRPYVSGSNNTSLKAERAQLRRMLDPVEG